ncbi:hypothetical protein DM01DRAFT_1145694 [Hesseltinella vesiculosa]|uniref:Uncharacterized protein n=1 Tax=Hesseltinella vesiculosa TaxID=101127 RepID=A0A1X2G7F6_9FUNG|nr:hypothetical protein DM01DRAFT_1145694 [Hesseltinella vesiculosa]
MKKERQRTGRSASTSKRKQGLDEKMDKQAARSAFEASLPKYGAPHPCTTCLNEAFKLEKQGDHYAAETTCGCQDPFKVLKLKMSIV